MTKDIPLITLVKKNGVWVTEGGDKVVMRPQTSQVMFKATGQYTFLITTGNRGDSTVYKIITDGEMGNIIAIKKFNAIMWATPCNNETYVDIDRFCLPSDHQLANSFYVQKDIDHEVAPTA